MEKMELLFKNYSNCSLKEYNEIQKIVNQDDGTTINSKEENGYIDIEYHNKIGEYKAKLLVKLFDEQKEFYQFFLSRFKKVIIQNNQPTDQTSNIIISNEPYYIEKETILNQILTPSEHEYLSLILQKLKDNNDLLTEEEALDLLRVKILEEDVKSKRIDFFKYLDLMKGRFINTEYYYKIAIVDLVFKYHCYPILVKYMNNQEKNEINPEIFKAIHQKYGLNLLNQSLEHQKELLKKYQEKNNENFISTNLVPLNCLFNQQIPQIIEKYKNVRKKKENKLNQETIIKLVLEFLNEIDNTETLTHELEENISNGNIMIWNPQDIEKRKIMQNKYNKNLILIIHYATLNMIQKKILLIQ